MEPKRKVITIEAEELPNGHVSVMIKKRGFTRDSDGDIEMLKVIDKIKDTYERRNGTKVN